MNALQETFDRVLEPIKGRMIRSIWRVVRDPHDAEDAMQNALSTIWKRWKFVFSHPNPQAVILKICIDAAYDHARRRYRDRRERESLSESTGPADASRTPPQLVQDTELHHELMSAIERLPRNQAIATLLRFVEGQSYGEIAAALGCSEVTARKHISRARSRLKAALPHLDQAITKASLT
jgi:RNA polymerase sigma-70 factor, ECF subfamily